MQFFDWEPLAGAWPKAVRGFGYGLVSLQSTGPLQGFNVTYAHKT